MKSPKEVKAQALARMMAPRNEPVTKVSRELNVRGVDAVRLAQRGVTGRGGCAWRWAQFGSVERQGEACGGAGERCALDALTGKRRDSGRVLLRYHPPRRLRPAPVAGTLSRIPAPASRPARAVDCPLT